MKGENIQEASRDKNSSGFLADTPVLLMVFAVLIAVAVSVLLVYFVEFEKLKDIATLFVTALAIFIAITYFLKIISEFFSKIVYGRKSNWKKDFSLNYANAESEDSQIAHSLAEKFSLGYLIYKESPDDKEKKIFLPVDSSFIVGRENSVDIHIDSQYLSKSHYMIRTDSDNIYAIDLNSTNGTKLNGARIKPGVKTKIAGDSELRAGRINFLVSVL